MKKFKFILTILFLLFQNGCANDIYYYQSKKRVKLTPIKSISRDLSNIDYYKNSRGIILGVTDKLLVKLKDKKYLNQILQEYNLTLFKKLDRNLFVLKAKDKSLTIQISNTLAKKDFVEYAYPDFIKKLHKR